MTYKINTCNLQTEYLSLQTQGKGYIVGKFSINSSASITYYYVTHRWHVLSIICVQKRKFLKHDWRDHWGQHQVILCLCHYSFRYFNAYWINIPAMKMCNLYFLCCYSKMLLNKLVFIRSLPIHMSQSYCNLHC